MFWIIVGGVSHGTRVIQVGGRVAGKASRYGGTNWVPASGPGITAPPHHDPVTLTLVLLVLGSLLAVLILAGVLLAIRQPSRKRAETPVQEITRTGRAVKPRPPSLRNAPPPVPRTPLGGLPAAPRRLALPPDPVITPSAVFKPRPTVREPALTPVPDQTLRIVEALYAIVCADCLAGRFQPCKLMRLPPGQTIVVYEERNWVCHESRIVAGTRYNEKLYWDLIRNWDGEIPAFMKGMH